MLPVIIRTTEEMLRIVPNELREASYALGVPKWRTVLKVVLPTSLAGIVTGAMLAVARVAGETAPLLLTTFLTQSYNNNPFAGPQAALPTFIWDQITSGTPGLRRPGLGGRARPHHPGHDVLHRREAPRRTASHRRDDPAHHEQVHHAAGRRHLLRRLQGRRGGVADGRAQLGHRVHRPVRMRQVDSPAHAQPDARGDPRALASRAGPARRRGHLRRRRRPGQRPPDHRHGVPATQPVPDHVDRRERAGRGAPGAASG